jgi:hypothetical protein
MIAKHCLTASTVILLALVIAGWTHIQKGPQTVSAQRTVTPPVRDVKVTSGPVVRSVTDTSALIAWSTNLSTDTLLRYGKRADNLDQVARAPWGGLTHSVQLKNLTPETTYYFRVGTSVAQNTEPMSATARLTTQATKKSP